MTNQAKRMLPPVLAAALLAAVAGCAGKAAIPPAAERAPAPTEADPSVAVIGNTDACAMRMHDLCGAFMLYLSKHPTLPPSLADLDTSMIPDVDAGTVFFCPQARQGYVYRPNGLLLPEKNARIILYDAAPAHSGFRLAIRAEEPDGGLAPVMKVVALPESFFLLRPPGSESPVPQRP